MPAWIWTAAIPSFYAAGQRNTYDIAFNPDGELFGFDSDMEYDWGTPWYCPIRVYHATSGEDGGFREGTAKWPDYYPDGLPPVVNIGIGCPTGVVFGAGPNFHSIEGLVVPRGLDLWTADGRLPQAQGINLRIDRVGEPHCSQESARQRRQEDDRISLIEWSSATMHPLLHDWAAATPIWSSSASAILRAIQRPGGSYDADGSRTSSFRHQLESLHSPRRHKTIEAASPYLDSSDRFIRYAARIAIEAQPADQWKAKALAETRPHAAPDSALLAVARLGGADAQAGLLKALCHLPMTSLTPRQQLEKLRVLEVAIARSGKPSPELVEAIIAELDPALSGEDGGIESRTVSGLARVGCAGAVRKA